MQHRLRRKRTVKEKIGKHNARVDTGGGALYRFQRADNQKWNKYKRPHDEQAGERVCQRRATAQKKIACAW